MIKAPIYTMPTKRKIQFFRDEFYMATQWPCLICGVIAGKCACNKIDVKAHIASMKARRDG